MKIKKNIPNIITSLRIIMSFVLLLLKPLSVSFYCVFVFCGLTDMVDGFLARKFGVENIKGAILDSCADIIFLIVCAVRLLPILKLPSLVIMWCIIIAFVRVISFLISKKRLIMHNHTTLDKITGFVLFVSVFFIKEDNRMILVSILCVIATITAIYQFCIALKNVGEQVESK